MIKNAFSGLKLWTCLSLMEPYVGQSRSLFHNAQELTHVRGTR